MDILALILAFLSVAVIGITFYLMIRYDKVAMVLGIVYGIGVVALIFYLFYSLFVQNLA
jgi:hypothetical protein